ncbi:MAG: hypothetical protein ACYCO9_09820 [Streptosporangiaceae bacterium]
MAWWSPVALIAIAAVVATGLASRYQPLRPGNGTVGSFPGLAAARGIRWVSRYLPEDELYVPVQKGRFALSFSLVNPGPFAVTIVGVTQSPGSPFSAAGPVRYLTDAQCCGATVTRPPRQVLHDVTLRPGHGIMIGMPLRFRYCAGHDQWVTDDSYLITERFAGFTRTVSMATGFTIVTNGSGGSQGPPGTFCRA